MHATNLQQQFNSLRKTYEFKKKLELDLIDSHVNQGLKDQGPRDQGPKD